MPDKLPKQIWFEAKRYGWGWGLATCWQGWLVYLTFVLLFVGAAFALLPKRPMEFDLAAVLLASLLIVVCWWKGEKPRWRWGKDS
jgi:hypothetical protein